MKKEQLINILSILFIGDYDFETEDTAVVYEFCKRRYEVTFKMIEGQFLNFTVQDCGEVPECN